MNSTAIRGELLAGLATDDEIAAALNVSVRTVYRLALPFTKVGARRYYDVAKCREALLSRQTGTRSAPRGKGRPRKAA